MSINVRLDRTFPGYGQGLRNDAIFVQSGIALSGTVQQSKPIPATGLLAPPTTTGKIRIKIYNGGGTSPTLTDLLVQASDGTNTIPIFWLHPTVAVALSTTSWLDLFFPYLLDTAASGAGGGATGQLSGVVGGATTFNVLTTLGGTSPTASMDLEIVPLI